MSIREELSDLYDDELLFLSEEEYDDAIIGVCEQFGSNIKVAYDGYKLLQIIMNVSNMDEESALEYLNYNIVGSYVGESTPVYIWKI